MMIIIYIMILIQFLMMSMTVECYVCVDGMIKTYVFFRLTWYLIMADENYNRWIIYMTINTTQLLYPLNSSITIAVQTDPLSIHYSSIAVFVLYIQYLVCRRMKTLIYIHQDRSIWFPWIVLMLIHPCEYKMRHFLSVAMGISLLVVSFLLIYHYRLTASIVWSRPSSGGNDDKSIVIAVLGGGLTSSGSVPLHTKLRLDKAIDLYHQLKSTHHQVIIIPLSAGTPYKPNPVDDKVENHRMIFSFTFTSSSSSSPHSVR
jgi:hypothetical protein